MKTVGEFKKAGVVFVVGDKCKDNNSVYTKGWIFDKSQDFDNCQITEFAWRDLTTKPDNPNFKIELDVDNHRWRPSLNQGVEYLTGTPISAVVTDNTLLLDGFDSNTGKSPEFKAGDLVECMFHDSSKTPLFNLIVKIAYIDDLYIFGYVHLKNEGVTDEGRIIEPYNPELNELKDIIGTHDDPTECAKAILAAGYNK